MSLHVISTKFNKEMRVTKYVNSVSHLFMKQTNESYMDQKKVSKEEKLACYHSQCHYLSKININKDEGIPFYPNYEFKHIQIDPPSVYYRRKILFKGPPELDVSPKIIPHKVDPEKLSDDHKPLADKSLFEKDLFIIEQKNQLLARNMNSHSNNRKRANSVNFHAKKKINSNINSNEEEEDINYNINLCSSPPNVFYREEEKRQLMISEREKQTKILKKRQKRQERRNKHQYEIEKKKIDSIAKERESERINQEKMMIEEKEKEMQKKREKYEKFKQAPLRSTRAANLRTEAANHKIETDRANQEREKLNSQLKAKRLKKQTKRISALIKSMNQDYNDECRARHKAEEMKKTERGWYRWLDKNEKSNEKKETMLERTLYATD